MAVVPHIDEYVKMITDQGLCLNGDKVLKFGKMIIKFSQDNPILIKYSQFDIEYLDNMLPGDRFVWLSFNDGLLNKESILFYKNDDRGIPSVIYISDEDELSVLNRSINTDHYDPMILEEWKQDVFI